MPFWCGPSLNFTSPRHFLLFPNFSILRTRSWRSVVVCLSWVINKRSLLVAWKVIFYFRLLLLRVFSFYYFIAGLERSHCKPPISFSSSPTRSRTAHVRTLRESVKKKKKKKARESVGPRGEGDFDDRGWLSRQTSSMIIAATAIEPLFLIQFLPHADIVLFCKGKKSKF